MIFNCTRILRVILNKSLKQHPTKQHLYGHLPPISKTIQVRRTRHAGHCWRTQDELISDVLLSTPAPLNHHQAALRAPTSLTLSLLLSLPISPYCPSLPTGLPKWNLCPHRAVGHASFDRSARTYLQQLCADTG